MKIYLRILKYVKIYKKDIGLSMIMSVFYSIFSALSVYLTIPLLKTLFLEDKSQSSGVNNETVNGFYQNIQRFFEYYIFAGSKQDALLKICILIAAAFFLKNLTGFLQSLYMQYAEKGVLKDVRYELYEKINNLSLRFFTNERTGNLISRMTNDINNIQSGISAAFLNLLKEPLLILIFLIMSFSISWQMTLLSFILFPLTIVAITKIGNSLRRRSQRVQVKLSEIVSIISETIYGAKIIRSFSAEGYRNNLFKKNNYEHYKLTIKAARTSELTSPITEVLSIFAGAVIIWYGGTQVLVYQNLKPEEFLGFLFILFQIIQPIKNLSSVNNRIQESAASGERIFEILDFPVEVQDKSDAKELSEFKNKIELKNVSFHYDKERQILSDINLEIRKSELVAVVGFSGAGKSTLADLIARFYDVTGGEIVFDGISLKDIRISSLRNLIGIVPQETILFNDTIRNNILCGLQNVSEERLIDTAKFANAYEFILETEKGFDSMIGERGLKLSGGQKQRLAIARALLRNPQILILDEATSSLDSESEIQVQEALDKLMVSRTSIVIAHRLSTVKKADKMVVLENGKIVQIGTHDELIKIENGVYKYLYELQFGKEN